MSAVSIESILNSHTNVKDSLSPTSSPRPLFPSISIPRELTLLERSAEEPTDEPDDERPLAERVYMFSQLLSDLEDICDLQMPFLDQMMDDLSENLSGSNEEEEDEAEDPDQQDYGISFFRGEYSWNMQAKKEEIPVADEEEDSEDECDVEVLSNASQTNEQMDPVIGRWTNRDVHDVKYNEDKLAITFKAGRLGIFGLAINWYSNLPYQSWELRPDVKELLSISPWKNSLNNYDFFFQTRLSDI